MCVQTAPRIPLLKRLLTANDDLQQSGFARLVRLNTASLPVVSREAIDNEQRMDAPAPSGTASTVRSER
jgi:hypothetical protein